MSQQLDNEVERQTNQLCISTIIVFAVNVLLVFVQQFLKDPEMTIEGLGEMGREGKRGGERGGGERAKINRKENVVSLKEMSE